MTDPHIDSDESPPPVEQIETLPIAADHRVWAGVAIADPNEMLTGDDALSVEAVTRAVETLRGEQRFQAGLVAAILTGIGCAVVWGAITASMDRQFAILAFGIGAAVGWAMRWRGKGIEVRFRVAAAAVAALACVTGNLLAVVTKTAEITGMGYFDVLGLLGPTEVWQVLSITTGWFDIVCYGFAIYYAAKVAGRQLTRGDMHAAALPSAKTL